MSHKTKPMNPWIIMILSLFCGWLGAEVSHALFSKKIEMAPLPISYNLPPANTPQGLPSPTPMVTVFVVAPTLEPTAIFPHGSVDSNGVFTANNQGDGYAPSPSQHLVCFDTDVRGGPDTFYGVLYQVKKGDLVKIYEFSRPDRVWVMIGSAEWIPWSALCH